MKTLSVSPPISWNIVLLGLLLATVSFIGVTGKRVPLLSNARIDIILVIVLGMAMCTQGIGRVAALGQWAHPLSILGYLLGVLILLVAATAFTGLTLPYIQSEQQALLAVAILTGVKIIVALLHYLLARNG